ncbi:MAG: hypothetical protein HRU00_17020 [Myxococcales bacterium]|nr:hypothetical protein [Myxococcales bacterium]
MSITGMSDRLITVKRRSSDVLTPVVAAASHSADVQPPVDSHIEVAISGGTSNTGTVTVLGLVGGVPDSEVLTFNGIALTQATTKRFDAGGLDTPAFTTTDLTDEATVPTITARSVGSDGSREHSAATVITDWPARFDRGRASWPNSPAGRGAVEKTRFYVDYTTVWDPRRGDVILDQSNGDQFKVHGQPDLHGASLTPHHWEIEVRENKGADAN